MTPRARRASGRAPRAYILAGAGRAAGPPGRPPPPPKKYCAAAAHSASAAALRAGGRAAATVPARDRQSSVPRPHTRTHMAKHADPGRALAADLAAMGRDVSNLSDAEAMSEAYEQTQRAAVALLGAEFAAARALLQRAEQLVARAEAEAAAEQRDGALRTLATALRKLQKTSEHHAAVLNHESAQQLKFREHLARRLVAHFAAEQT